MQSSDMFSESLEPERQRLIDKQMGKPIEGQLNMPKYTDKSKQIHINIS